MTLDHISATMTYMMWCEEHLWNVILLQRLHLSNLVGAMQYLNRLSKYGQFNEQRHRKQELDK
jgi:hypothetical protein